MNTTRTNHLSMEELDLLLMQQPAPEAAAHAAACEHCAEELASMASLFSDFRSTSLAFSADQYKRTSAQSRRASLLPVQKHFAWRPVAAWSACAVVLAAIMVPLSHHTGLPQTPVAPAVTTASVEPPALSDEALLNHIQDDLTSTVPDAMAPLAPTAVPNQAQVQITPRN